MKILAKIITYYNKNTLITWVWGLFCLGIAIQKSNEDRFWFVGICAILFLTLNICINRAFKSAQLRKSKMRKA